MQSSIPAPIIPPRRPWGTRIKDSFKARWPGYPLIIGLVVISYFVGKAKSGRQRFFVERDPTLSYPYVDDTVPSWSLALIGAVGPILLIFFAQTLIRRSPRGIYFDRRTKDLHLAFIVILEVLAVTYLITNILKAFVGRLRPNFFAYCDYKSYRDALDMGDLTAYFANTVVGQPGSFRNCKYEISDAHYSFPSGHSSISFCGLTFLTLFLLHVTSRINFTHHAVGKIIRFFIILVPLFSAALVAASRVIDYKHNVDDTVWGALIGILGAMLAFHANYSYSRPAVAGVPVTGGEIIPFPEYFDQYGIKNRQVQNLPREEIVPTTHEHVGKITPSSPLVSKMRTSADDVV